MKQTIRQILVQRNSTELTTIKKSWEWLKRGIRVSAVCLAFYGWWGVIYPELSLLPSTYEVVYDDTASGNPDRQTVQNSPEVIKWNFDNRICRKLLEAPPEQIRYKSRLLEFLEADDHSKD